jgi:predicted restriction endonuclease
MISSNANGGPMSSYQQEYYQKNKDRIKAQHKAYYQKNKKKVEVKRAEWLSANKDKSAAYKTAWAEENPDKVRAAQKRTREKLRTSVFEHYGNKCACCGEDRWEFLTIDHIQGGGNKHRKGITSSIYHWLRKMDYPKGFRVLCYNCNMALGRVGYCPHQRGKEK